MLLCVCGRGSSQQPSSISCNLLTDNYVKHWLKAGVENLRLPQGTNLIVNVFGLHRRHDVWGENAEKFDPENFSSHRVNERHHFAYVPFASGLRLCIGEWS